VAAAWAACTRNYLQFSGPRGARFGNEPGASDFFGGSIG
jgi:hypothetical protein